MPYNAKTNWRNNDIVTPEDLNRMEQGIADSASPADDILFYVYENGSDETGTGDINKPFRTIQKAIDAIPTSNNLSKLCYIKVGAGQYPGFTMSTPKKVEFIIQGDVQIMSDVVINAGTVFFADEADAAVYLTDSQIIMSGGNFMSMIMVGVTTSDQNVPLDAVAVDCSAGSKFGVHADLVITHHTTAVRCSHSHVHLKRMMTDKTATGIVCECGIVQLGDDVLQATTKFITQDGGRIYVGAQTNMPNY